MVQIFEMGRGAVVIGIREVIGCLGIALSVLLGGCGKKPGDAAEVVSWAFVDGGTEYGLNYDSNYDVFAPQLGAVQDRLYLIWREFNGVSMQVRAAVYHDDDAKPVWTFIDGAGDAGLNYDPRNHAFDPQLAAFQSKLYATWYEALPGADGRLLGATQIRVAEFNGDEKNPRWRFIDGGAAQGLNRDSVASAAYPQLMAFNKKLYLIWEEYNGIATQIRVAVYAGDDQSPPWRFVDGGGVPGLNLNPMANAGEAHMTVYDGRLYAAWRETAHEADQIRVAVYNGNDDKPAWRLVDGGQHVGLNIDPRQPAFTPQLGVFDGKLFICWQENGPEALQVRVAVYTGDDSQPVWMPVDGGGSAGLNHDPARIAYAPHMAAYGKRLYVSWFESNGAYTQVRIRAFTDEDGAPLWRFVDGGENEGINQNQQANAFDPHLAVHRNKLYATWRELNSKGRQQLHVAVAKTQ
ncbi:MAG: hypothetical protein AB1810_01580 [Pseudomonadota bacterium]